MTRRAAPRGGFTLIELLVVITIIAILISLTAAGVMRVRRTATRTVERTTIGQIYSAVGSYKAKMNATHIPATFVARTDYTSAAALADPNSVASAVYLKAVFPQMNLTATPLGTAYGDGKTLDGNQTLVLFLTGGIPTKGTGFSNNRTAPFAAAVAGEQRIGPFYEKIDKIDANGRLLDSWGNPYAYFSHNPAQGVGSYQGGPYTLNATTIAEALRSTPNGSSPAKYWDPKGCQIISAGLDGKFGPGGYWQPGLTVYVEGQIGGDDLSSFNGGPLLAQN